MIRSKEGIQPVCSLASGDQCSVAIGKIADCAAADYLSTTSLLVIYLHLDSFYNYFKFLRILHAILIMSVT